MRYFSFSGLAAPGSIVCTPALLGETVSVVDPSGVDRSSLFESLISVAGHIQQISEDDLSENTYIAVFVRNSTVLDYTSLALVKSALGAEATTEDGLLQKRITASSRAIDRLCSGKLAVDGYFALESFTDQILRGQVDSDGRIHCWTKKPYLTEILSASYRYTPRDSWTTISALDWTVDGREVLFWVQASRQPIFVKLSYSGGFSETVEDLPTDLVEAATLLSVRAFKEIKSGLGDSVGVAELGQMIYTKAWPQRVLSLLDPYRNRVAF